MNISLGISKFLFSQARRQMVQNFNFTGMSARLHENIKQDFNFINMSRFHFIKVWDILNGDNIISTNIPFKQAISSVLERSKSISIEDAILNINTHQRKKAKVKREKRQQRRKKIRRLSERKREKYNY